jgi:hypothetical protein
LIVAINSYISNLEKEHCFDRIGSNFIFFVMLKNENTFTTNLSATEFVEMSNEEGHGKAGQEHGQGHSSQRLGRLFQ